MVTSSAGMGEFFLDIPEDALECLSNVVRSLCAQSGKMAALAGAVNGLSKNYDSLLNRNQHLIAVQEKQVATLIPLSDARKQNTILLAEQKDGIKAQKEALSDWISELTSPCQIQAEVVIASPFKRVIGVVATGAFCVGSLLCLPAAPFLASLVIGTFLPGFLYAVTVSNQAFTFVQLLKMSCASGIAHLTTAGVAKIAGPLITFLGGQFAGKVGLQAGLNAFGLFLQKVMIGENFEWRDLAAACLGGACGAAASYHVGEIARRAETVFARIMGAGCAGGINAGVVQGVMNACQGNNKRKGHVLAAAVLGFAFSAIFQAADELRQPVSTKQTPDDIERFIKKALNDKFSYSHYGPKSDLHPATLAKLVIQDTSVTLWKRCDDAWKTIEIKRVGNDFVSTETTYTGLYTKTPSDTITAPIPGSPPEQQSTHLVSPVLLHNPPNNASSVLPKIKAKPMPEAALFPSLKPLPFMNLPPYNEPDEAPTFRAFKSLAGPMDPLTPVWEQFAQLCEQRDKLLNLLKNSRMMGGGKKGILKAQFRSLQKQIKAFQC